MHHSKGKGLLIELNCNLVNVLSIYLLVKEKSNEITSLQMIAPLMLIFILKHDGIKLAVSGLQRTQKRLAACDRRKHTFVLLSYIIVYKNTGVVKI